MPTPREAIDVLQNFLMPRRGLQIGGGNAADVLELNDLRDSLRDEMSTRVGRDLSVGDTRSARGDQYALEDIQDEMDDDPYTGTAERARLGKIRNTLDAANTTLRTEVDDASRAQSDRNAFGAFLTKRAGYQADTSPVGTAALDAASRRKVDEASAASGDKLYEKMMLQQTKPVTLSANGKNAMTALNDIEALAPGVLSRLRTEHPGVENGDHGGVMDVASERLKRLGYNFGLYRPNEDIGQMTQLLRVIAARPYMAGRPNQRIYEDIVSHLGEFGFSPAADYARLSKVLSLVPDMKQAIEDAERPMAAQPPGINMPSGRSLPAPGAGRPALQGAGPWILRDGKLVSKDSAAPPNVSVRRLPD